MSNRSKASNLIEATDDLRMALRCIRELAKQRRVGKGVWEAAWDWQDEAHQRWCKELSEMGHVSSIATARCDHLKTYDRKPVIITGGCAGLQRTPSSSMET
jgi:predicted amidohydrolase YtcJ